MEESISNHGDGRVKYLDIIKPCPNAHMHYHLRKLFKDMPYHGGFTPRGAVLLIEDKKDPCKSYIIVEKQGKTVAKVHPVVQVRVAIARA